MAYLSKEQYQKRNEKAHRRMLENKNIDTLTDEQHDAIAKVCDIRHKIHSNKRDVIVSDSDKLLEKLVEANINLFELEIEPMSFVPNSTDDYIDIDTIELLYQIEQVPLDEDKRQEWYDSNYYRISNELEELNTKIENYLSEIDEKYGTNYSPTGALRIMKSGGQITNIWNMKVSDFLNIKLF